MRIVWNGPLRSAAPLAEEPKLGMATAIRAAEAAEGGRTLSASLVIRNGLPGYEIHLLMPDGAARSVFVDDHLGDILVPPGQDLDEGKAGETD